MFREPWRTRLLFLSFAVNLVAIPMAASRYFNHPPPLAPGAPPPQIMITHMAELLSKRDAEKLRAAMEPHLEDIQVARVHMEAARRDMTHILVQPQFDREAASAAMKRWQDQWHVWSKSFGDAVLDGFSQISPEGRRHLADRGRRGGP